MSLKSMKKVWFINSPNNWYFGKAIFSRLFSASYHILKKKKKKKKIKCSDIGQMLLECWELLFYSTWPAQSVCTAQSY